MIQTIYYKSKNSIKTRNPLCEISRDDHDYLIKVMNCYMDLARVDPRWQFEDWFNKPNADLPKQPQNNFKRNSPKSWCEGIINKLNQSGCDLSPQQCQGIETLANMIVKWYDGDRCPNIKFSTKLQEKIDNSRPAVFNDLFGE